VLNLVFAAYYPYTVKAQIVLRETIPPDGNTIALNVIYKPNMPTTEEEVAAVKKYEEDQKAQPPKRKKVAVQSTAKSYAKNQAPTSYSACNCVSYARWKTGINVGSIGLARYHPINHQTPIVGAIGVMKYNASAAGHLFAVDKLEPTRMWISEANWSRCRVTSRWVPLTYGEGFYY
jgi:hypothetical protein